MGGFMTKAAWRHFALSIHACHGSPKSIRAEEGAVLDRGSWPWEPSSVFGHLYIEVCRLLEWTRLSSRNDIFLWPPKYETHDKLPWAVVVPEPSETAHMPSPAAIFTTFQRHMLSEIFPLFPSRDLQLSSKDQTPVIELCLPADQPQFVDSTRDQQLRDPEAWWRNRWTQEIFIRLNRK